MITCQSPGDKKELLPTLPPVTGNGGNMGELAQ